MNALPAGTTRTPAAPWPAVRTGATSIALLLLLHAAVWTWAGAISRTNLDIPGDMVEAFAWGRHFEWGYFKHPPLMAWMAGAWFALLPVSETSYAALAAANTALGLAGFTLLAREFLPRRWWLVALAAAMLTPGTTTMAMRFNANAVLVATWPWATAFFVRFMNRGRIGDAFACATAAALAMLGKYFSVVLLLALLLTALAHPPWRKRLLSRRALAALALFALLLAPHLMWLAEHDYAPLVYMREATNIVHEHPLRRAVHFGYSHLFFPVLGFALLAISAAGPGRRAFVLAALRDLLRPSTAPVWLLALLPVVLTVLGTAITGARTSVVWGLPMSMGLILYFAVRLAAHGMAPQRRAAFVYLAVIWLAVIALAPLSWWLGARRSAPAMADPRAELAQAVAAQWSARYGAPLRWISGTPAYAASVAFYADSHPRYWAFADPQRESPWADLKALRQSGSAVVCEPDDADCLTRAGRLAGPGRILTVAKQARGFAFAARPFRVFELPPGADAPAAR